MYLLRKHILGVLTHTTAWYRLWKGDETLKKVSIYVAWLHFTQYYDISSSVSPHLIDPKGSVGNPDYIFTLSTCQATFISDIM